ncbi:MAG: hypothetical protein QW567_01995 [Candidatus Hadarchaeales archaeon]
MRSEIKIKTRRRDALEKAEEYMRAAGYRTRIEGNSLKAVDGRDYNAGVCFALLALIPVLVAIVVFLNVLSNPMAVMNIDGMALPLLVILCVSWGLFPVYWFTREKNTVSVTVMHENAVINFRGKKGASAGAALKEMLE